MKAVKSYGSINTVYSDESLKKHNIKIDDKHHGICSLRPSTMLFVAKKNLTSVANMYWPFLYNCSAYWQCSGKLTERREQVTSRLSISKDKCGRCCKYVDGLVCLLRQTQPTSTNMHLCNSCAVLQDVKWYVLHKCYKNHEKMITCFASLSTVHE